MNPQKYLNEKSNLFSKGDIFMKKIIVIIMTCIFFVMTVTGCGAKDKPKDITVSVDNQKLADVKTKLDKEFTDYFGAETFSGYVYISKKGNVLLDKGYGKADFDKGTTNTKQTKFDIASLTKQITALAIMQLEEKKLLDVNDKVDKYLPSFPHGNEITIHQLLSHTSGLPQHSTEFDIKKFRPSNKSFGIEGKDENVKLTFTPGTSFQYSNAGYILLGYIIEKVSGKTLNVYFSENIFKPLDMKNTGFKDENGQLDNLAVGYQSENKEIAEKPWNLLNIGPVLGSSALCSTAEDMIKWEKALTQQKLLSKESYNKIYTPNKNSYGYGWYINKDSQGKSSYEHYGSASGYRSYILRSVDEDLVVIVESNFQNVPLEDMVSLLKDYLK
jgi:CubicO group peptidase (beta-lactamase class C family)